MIDDPYSVLGLTPDASDEGGQARLPRAGEKIPPGHESGRPARGGDDEPH
ncbi:MAG: hypothetical protein ACLRSV_05980 [Oscillospiraceae bacterium]